MTFQDIHAALSEAGKPVSDVQIYRYMRRFKIKPETKVLTIPRRYPAQSAAIIIKGLGLVTVPGATAILVNNGLGGRSRVVSLKELRTVRKKAGRR